MDLDAYVSAARRRMVGFEKTSPAEWDRIIEDGLKSAYADRDGLGLASMVQLMGHLLESVGRYDDVLGEIDHGLSFAVASPDSRLLLLGIKASTLVATGDTEWAARLGKEGDLLLPACQSAIARAKYRAFRLSVRWQTLEAVAQAEVDGLLAELAALKLWHERLFLLSWLIPYFAATRSRSEVRPWIRSLRLESAERENRWRAQDADTFEAWEQLVRGASLPAWDAATRRSRNAMAGWRHELLRLRDALVRRDSQLASLSIDRIENQRARLGAADVGSVAAYRWVAESLLHTDALVPSCAQPSNPMLNTLGLALAAGEAVAAVGSQAEATSALDRLTGLPVEVRSSVEWPVSRDRIEGLLAVRSGDLRRGRRSLEAAVEWSAANGYATELATSRLQLAELCCSADLRLPEHHWRELRKQAIAEFRELAIDPAYAAYTVTRALTLTGRDRWRNRLTRRERDVLQQLAAGATYKQAAGELGVTWQTVQTLAHRVYDKLGASGRIAAVNEAKRRGIL